MVGIHLVTGDACDGQKEKHGYADENYTAFDYQEHIITSTG